jgi:hypothetical protein
MPPAPYVVDARPMLFDVLGALLFVASFMFAWSTIGAVQERRVPPGE